ncbi:MAG TPA: glycogen debranching N-terminal domain-containing protein, partial [Pseudolabrys sp.]|nr:glycogen debranching N-terminal domain-containing protein [Pseudolabrys sp.]
MTFEISVGPPQLAINQGHSVLLTDPDGQIRWPSNMGLYFFDTRLISSWTIYANGEPWTLLNAGNIFFYASRTFLINSAISTERGNIPARTLGLVLSRSISGGVHEDLDIVNHGMKAVRFNLEIAIRSDFADLFEVKSGHIVRRGRITTEWSDDKSQLRMIYRNRDFRRDLTILIQLNDSRPAYANGRISFEVDLAPGAAWHSCLLYEPGNGDARFSAPEYCIAQCHQSEAGRRLDDWQKEILKIHTSNEEFYRLNQQAIRDMASLRLPIEGTNHLQFVPAAGVPWFVALFGRDSLIVSLQNALVYPDFARGALNVLGSWQATERDDYRDAEPGKIMHELRLGELAHFKLVPHTPYYGTADATMLYLIVLHTAWRSTGDRSLLDRHLPTAERCLEWIDKYGDRDGDGFQEYATRSSAGYENQGWKDSGDAVMNEDGSLVKGPKALCELQGYVYDAWLRMAEIFDELGKADSAHALRAKATTLFNRFNEAFWDEDSGFYAYALDGDKKKVLTVASNPGHCLWSGIVPENRAGRVVKRLMAPDMWSGWGIRTLSSDHPTYNPYSYQNGSVWPHDNGFIALGFRRYGFAAEAARVARDVSGAGSYFMQHQMPELYAGLQHNLTNFPVQYLGANVPQAWAAGSTFVFLK